MMSTRLNELRCDTRVFFVQEKMGVPVKHIVFSIVPVQPFRLDLTAWALRRRPANTIDCWDGETFRRALMIDGQIVKVAVRQEGQPESRTAPGELNWREAHRAHTNVDEVSAGANVGATSGFGFFLQTGEA